MATTNEIVVGEVVGVRPVADADDCTACGADGPTPEAHAHLDARLAAADPKWARFLDATVRRYPSTGMTTVEAVDGRWTAGEPERLGCDVCGAGPEEPCVEGCAYPPECPCQGEEHDPGPHMPSCLWADPGHGEGTPFDGCPSEADMAAPGGEP